VILLQLGTVVGRELSSRFSSCSQNIFPYLGAQLASNKYFGEIFYSNISKNRQ